ELRQTFMRGNERVVVHIAYYTAQVQGQELVNSENVLVTTKDPQWHEVGRSQVEVKLDGKLKRMRLTTLAGTQGRFDVAWWYWVDGRMTTSDAVAKGWLALSRLRLRADDSAAVFLLTEPSGRTDGAEILQRFAADMSVAIERVLAAAREDGQ
ncbi:MAG: exosortase C-terminal domain/associated protein EpsI, partial [Candidatus Binataceae bacterium]